MMEEARDPAIKLFGKTISVPEIAASADSYTIGGGGDDGSGALDGYGGGDEEEVTPTPKVESEGDGNDANSEVQTSTQPSHEPTHQTTTSSPDENSEAPTSCDSEQNSNKQEQEKKRQPSSSQESILKKPDKILPCPRCSSMETKFCYFNNYNVNQPRHFCKNCQRYWTAGGTMRNVPVGSGRRKIKSSAAQYHQVLVSKSLHNPGSDIHSQSILKHFEKQQVFKVNSKENGGLDQIEVEVGESIAMTKEEGGSDWLHVYHPPIACFQGPIWPVSWNSTQWEGFNHGVGPNRFSLGFYPAGAYWGCSVPAGSWASSSIQLVPPSSVVQSPGYQSITSSGPSLTLGKHSRDGSILRSSSGSVEGAKDKDNDNDSPSSERCLWVPKTLRIVDDPEEAAKSSIWTSLGIMNRKSDSICAGGIFKACFEKVDDESRYVKNFRTLEVNPAALSRSQALNESSGLG